MMRLFSRGPVARLCVPSQPTAALTVVSRFYAEQSSSSRPKFEFMSVQDDPAKGYMLRASVDEKRVIITFFPQLGPRKSDPNDPAPQFDFAARRSIRLFQHEVAGLLTVCEGKAAKHQIESSLHDLSFNPAEGNGYLLQGTLAKKSNPIPWAVQFDGYKATMFRHFLNSALNTSFGFQKHFRALEQRDQAQFERYQNQRNSRQNNNSSSNGNNNNNSSNGNNNNNNGSTNNGNYRQNNNGNQNNGNNNNNGSRNNNRRQYSN
ncbi:mitochondrial RNA binding protein 1, putative [Bodo saltans]|uniref:Mitochondrial RNA binding protein 1, putative n=1 Tax=Bodo saltans TaxID=75058 RepID=A0A0S4JEF9_BODSA|nr:mitochondrial RNA binding protein 1, putative [Bodo saltans]|eukprot:CUG88677.1 mitochondrial RNA binding protein 1, putative [Bodo saltans]